MLRQVALIDQPPVHDTRLFGRDFFLHAFAPQLAPAEIMQPEPRVLSVQPPRYFPRRIEALRRMARINQTVRVPPRPQPTGPVPAIDAVVRHEKIPSERPR